MLVLRLSENGLGVDVQVIPPAGELEQVHRRRVLAEVLRQIDGRQEPAEEVGLQLAVEEAEKHDSGVLEQLLADHLLSAKQREEIEV